MRKKKILLTLFISLFCGALTAQDFYIKPYVRYHQSISSQVEPDFYLPKIAVSPIAGGNGTILMPNIATDEDFSLSS
jgi:hypothetical protein